MFDENPKYTYESSLGSDKKISEQIAWLSAVNFPEIELVKLNLFDTSICNYILTFMSIFLPDSE